MATSVRIDSELVERVYALSDAETEEAAITMALHDFIARRQQRRVLDLVGALDWDPSYDYKAERVR